jgi:rhodanese-related sulfurtransferase
MTVQDLATMLDDNSAGDWQIIDVREPWEQAICSLPWARLLPMAGLPQRLAELDPKRRTVVVCHHGVRSYQVALWLERSNFTDVVSLRGGIDAWARDVDPTMAIY